jgi:hypothetical protein
MELNNRNKRWKARKLWVALNSCCGADDTNVGTVSQLNLSLPYTSRVFERGIVSYVSSSHNIIDGQASATDQPQLQMER